MAKAAAAQIGASLAVQNAHAQFTREIEINTWPSRFELIKRAMNGEVRRSLEKHPCLVSIRRFRFGLSLLSCHSFFRGVVRL